MPVRISARSLGPLSPAANTRRCQLPSATGKPGRICEKPAPGILSANGGHGGAARPRSRRGYGSLSESAVEPEPASESIDDTNEVVSRSSASPSSNAAAALKAARALSAASRKGCTTRPSRRCGPSTGTGSASRCRHQAFATGTTRDACQCCVSCQNSAVKHCSNKPRQ
jgi:hypothetical protein